MTLSSIAALQQAAQKAADEMARYAPILHRVEDFDLWPSIAAGLGIATTNGYVKALADLRAALATSTESTTQGAKNGN